MHHDTASLVTVLGFAIDALESLKFAGEIGKEEEASFGSSLETLKLCRDDFMSNATLYRILFSREELTPAEDYVAFHKHAMKYIMAVCKKYGIKEYSFRKKPRQPEAGSTAQDGDSGGALMATNEVELAQKKVCLFFAIISNIKAIECIAFDDDGVVVRCRDDIPEKELTNIDNFLKAEFSNDVNGEISAVKKSVALFLAHLLEEKKQRLVTEVLGNTLTFGFCTL
ncbi:MAG: hypothetical protein LBF72_00320 [Holosporales bacterium]|jgi:hypothetical protein|nr:hypothetical protein [Holosporales bacterium]